MSKSVRLRRGTTLDHLQFAGAEGEVTVDTTTDTVRVHDGSKLGGWPLLNTEKNSEVFSEEFIARKILYRNSYTTLAAFPSAQEYPGMVAFNQADQRAYVSTGTVWKSFTEPGDLTGFVIGSVTTGGAGASILPPQNKVGTNLVFKTIQSGANVLVTQDNNTISIASAQFTGANLQDSSGVVNFYQSTQGTEHQFRSLRTGTGLTSSLSVSNNEVNIDTVLKQAYNTVTVDGVTIPTTTADNTLTFTSAAGITLTPNVSNKSISVAVNLSVTNNTQQSGSDVLASYSSGAFVFNKIQAGAGVELTQGVDGEIVVSAPQVGTVTGGENLGLAPGNPEGGVAIFESALSTDSTLKFRRVRVGAGLIVTMSPDQSYLDLALSSETEGGLGGGGAVQVGDFQQLAFYPTADASSTVGPTPAGISVNVSEGVIVADIDGTVTDISNHDTDALDEGSVNLYWTEARFDASLAAKSTTDLAEGTALYFTDERAQDAAAAMMTAGNPTPQQVQATAQAASTSTATITIANTSGLAAGNTVTGPGFPAGVTIQTVLSGTTFTVAPAVFAPTGTFITIVGASTLIVSTTANATSTATVTMVDATNIQSGQYVTGVGVTGRVTVSNISTNTLTVAPGYNFSVALGAVLTFRNVTVTGVVTEYKDSDNEFVHRVDDNYLGDRIRQALSVVPGQGLSYDPVQGRFGLAGAVTSVNGFSGAVQLSVGDITGAAPIANPVFTGNPRAPTPIVSSVATAIATKQYVDDARTAVTGAPLPGLATIQALGAAINGDTLFFQTVQSGLNSKLNITGGTLNGLLNLNYTIDFTTTGGLVAANKQYVDQRASVQTVNTKTGNVVLNTDDVFERVTPSPVNLWFTQARARQSIGLTTDDPDVLNYNIGTGVFTFVKPGTDQIVEGSNNLYWTTSRTRESIGINVTGSATFASYNSNSGVFTFNATTDNLSQGVSNLFYTDTLARNAITLNTNVGQASLLTYNNATGQFSINPNTSTLTEGGGNLFFTNSRARLAFNHVVTQLNDVAPVNSFTYNNSTGQFNFNANSNSITEGTNNLYFRNDRARAAISLLSNDTGVLSYDNATGVFTFNKPNTDLIAEGGNNLYFTQLRARQSISVQVTQNNGQAVSNTATYDNATGVFTVNANTDNIAEGTTNRYASIGRVASIISLGTTTNDGATPGALLSYNNSDGAFTFNNSTDSLREGSVNKWASAATVRSFFSTNTQTALTYTAGTGVISFVPTVSPSLVYTASPGGGQFHFNTAQDLTETGTPKFRYVRNTVRTGVGITAGEVTIDLNQGTVHEINRNNIITTISIVNVPTTGNVVEVTLVFNLTTTAQSFTNTNTNIKWANATIPVWTSVVGRRDIVKLMTWDGNVWYETSRSLAVG
jgi:hypothetical protein